MKLEVCRSMKDKEDHLVVVGYVLVGVDGGEAGNGKEVGCSLHPHRTFLRSNGDIAHGWSCSPFLFPDDKICLFPIICQVDTELGIADCLYP